MDVERTLQFLVESHAQFVSDLHELRATTQKNHNDLVSVVREIAEILRAAEEDRRLAEQDRLRTEAENREAHKRFEELHRETDERFHVLIKMMDEWIRERRNGRDAPDKPPTTP